MIYYGLADYEFHSFRWLVDAMSVDKKQLQHTDIEQEFHKIIFNFFLANQYILVYIIILRLEQNFTAELVFSEIRTKFQPSTSTPHLM